MIHTRSPLARGRHRARGATRVINSVNTRVRLRLDRDDVGARTLILIITNIITINGNDTRAARSSRFFDESLLTSENRPFKRPRQRRKVKKKIRRIHKTNGIDLIRIV